MLHNSAIRNAFQNLFVADSHYILVVAFVGLIYSIHVKKNAEIKFAHYTELNDITLVLAYSFLLYNVGSFLVKPLFSNSMLVGYLTEPSVTSLFLTTFLSTVLVIQLRLEKGFTPYFYTGEEKLGNWIILSSLFVIVLTTLVSLLNIPLGLLNVYDFAYLEYLANRYDTNIWTYLFQNLFSITVAYIFWEILAYMNRTVFELENENKIAIEFRDKVNQILARTRV